MHIPTTHRSTPGNETSAQFEFYGNLAIYGLVTIAVVIILVMLTHAIHDCFQSDHMIDDYESSSEEDSEEEAEPWNVTLPADGRLESSNSVLRPGVVRYGTFQYYAGTWYHTDGYVFYPTYCSLFSSPPAPRNRQ